MERQAKTELPVVKELERWGGKKGIITFSEALEKLGRQAKAELPVVEDWKGWEGKLRQNYL